MPPKKSKEVDVPNTTQQTSDHELFLQAFEKPTQIYRYLKTRLVNTPIFLNRNLTYMKHRMSRTHIARKTFTVDSMLEKIKAKQFNLSKSSKEYLTVSYIGYFDKNAEFSEDQVKVDTMLLKLCHKKRKDVKCPVFTENIGTSYISINPDEDNSVPKVLNTLNISSDKFNVNSNYTVKSYHLIISVVREDSHHLPALENTASNALSLNNNSSSTATTPSLSATKSHLGASIVIFDKQKQPLLEGEYEIQMESYTSLLSTGPTGPTTHNNNSAASHFASDFSGASWEMLDKVEDIVTSGLEFQDYNETPKIKVRLGWSAEPMKTIVHMKPGLESGTDHTMCNKENNRPDGLPSSMKPSSLELTTSSSGGGGGGVTTTTNTLSSVTSSTNVNNSNNYSGDDMNKPIKVVYQFVYNNNSRQQTTACDDFKCPWCRLDCRFLYSLVKHLRYCHPRFKFTYHPMLNGALIDVAINSSFNKGYLGAPHHLIDQPVLSVDQACVPYRKQPRQRCIGSELLVYYPRRHRKHSMTEFLNDLQDDVDTDGHRPVVSGHNRLYHHTITCLPVLPKEMDQDSDDQKDPKWLQTKTKMMIDEFTDVNEGEKELMKMWNLHVMKYGFVGDCQIPLACSMFLESNGKALLRRNLYRNFVLHLCNMFDFGLLSGLAVYTTLQKLQNLILLDEGDSTSSEFSQVLKRSCEAQRLYWIQEGSKRAPKLLEIRPPLSSPTGDGVRRKPAGNYSPVHSPSVGGSSSSATPTISTSTNDKPSKQSSAQSTSSSLTNEKRDKTITGTTQSGGGKRKLSIEDSKGAGGSRKLSIEEKGGVASRKLSIEDSKGGVASRKLSIEDSKGASGSRKLSIEENKGASGSRKLSIEESKGASASSSRLSKTNELSSSTMSSKTTTKSSNSETGKQSLGNDKDKVTPGNSNNNNNSAKKCTTDNLRKRVASLDDTNKTDNGSNTQGGAASNKKRRISSPDLKMASCRVVLEDSASVSIVDKGMVSRTRQSLNNNGNGSNKLTNSSSTTTNTTTTSTGMGAGNGVSNKLGGSNNGAGNGSSKTSGSTHNTSSNGSRLTGPSGSNGNNTNGSGRLSSSNGSASGSRLSSGSGSPATSLNRQSSSNITNTTSSNMTNSVNGAYSNIMGVTTSVRQSSGSSSNVAGTSLRQNSAGPSSNVAGGTMRQNSASSSSSVGGTTLRQNSASSSSSVGGTTLRQNSASISSVGGTTLRQNSASSSSGGGVNARRKSIAAVSTGTSSAESSGGNGGKVDLRRKSEIHSSEHQ